MKPTTRMMLAARSTGYRGARVDRLSREMQRHAARLIASVQLRRRPAGSNLPPIGRGEAMMDPRIRDEIFAMERAIVYAYKLSDAEATLRLLARLD